jgi:hypothetical protein
MFLLIGALVAVDVLFLVVVTAIDQSRLRVVTKETMPTVCYVKHNNFAKIILLHLQYTEIL